MSDSVNVCVCYRVSEARIVHVIEQGAGTPEEVGNRCMAGRGCGDCRELLEELIEDYGTGGRS